MKLRRSCIAVFSLSLLALPACGGDDGGGGAQSGGAADTIVIGTTDSLQNSFDPAQAYDYFGSEVIQNTAETLVTYKPNATEPSPLLAAAMPAVSADGLTYTFELRPGVKFHDGTALDSAAVKFSLERARDFGEQGRRGGRVPPVGDQEHRHPVAHHGGDHPDEPNVTFLSRLGLHRGHHRQPHRLHEPCAGRLGSGGPAVKAKYKTDTVVGSGPYKLVAYKEKESVDFEANPDYWGDAPKTERVLIRLFDKSSALKLALQNKEVDVAYRTLQPDENSFFKDQAGLQRWSRARAAASATSSFNVTPSRATTPTCAGRWPPPSTGRRVVREVLKGTAKPLPSMIPPTFPRLASPSGPSCTGRATDKAKVDRYLTAAGVPAGQKVDVDFWFSPTHYGDTEAGGGPGASPAA